MSRAAVVCLLSGVLVVWACGSPATVQERMFDHYARAGQVQSALIMGDLEGARRPARWLGEHEALSEVAPEAEAWTAALRIAATEVAGARSLAEAAEATGRMAASCAGCHQEVGDGPRFRSMSEVPPEGATTGTHMVRHLWAMDRMWEGLIGGGDGPWQDGADALARQSPEDEFPGGSTTAALARTLHDQAAQARDVPEWARPRAYAAMIEACAACHSLSGFGGD
ncbi:MAG: hypothetical protein P8188_18840 [Gemmatimonadota bacterium]